MAFPAATDSQPRLTLEEFSLRALAYAPRETTGVALAKASFGDEAADRDTPGEAPRVSTANIKIDIQDDVKADPVVVALPAENPPPAAATLDNAPIEFPVPSGVVVNEGIPAGVPLPPIAKPVVARSKEEICDTLTKSAQINNLPAPFFIRLLFRESRFDPAVVSNAGAQGIAQFMPGTAADMGVENPFDPALAIPASARLLSNLVRQFGNLGLAAAAYNAGPKRVQDWLGSKGKGKLPDETQGYVKIITGHPVEKWSEAAAQHPGEKLPRRAPCQDSAGLLAWNGPDIVPVPQPSPLRSPPAEKSPADKPIVVAALRSDMREADRAEREAAARSSVKTPVRSDVKSAAANQPKNQFKNQPTSRPKSQPKNEPKIEAKNEPKIEAKIETKSTAKGTAANADKSAAHSAAVAARAFAKPGINPAGKSAPNGAGKREKIAQR